METPPSQQGVVKKKETRGRKPKPKEDKKDEQQQSHSKTIKESKKMQQQHQHQQQQHHQQQQQASVDEKYTQWKSLVPVLYDWLANHNLVWPSLSCRCFLSPISRVFVFSSLILGLVLSNSIILFSFVHRWGPQLEQATYKNRQRLYLSEQAILIFYFLFFMIL